MPSRRGVWLEVASGQMLRHTPGATMNSTGSTGMTPFQNTFSPVSGTAISSPATTSAPSQTHRPDRAPRREAQARRDLRVVGERDRGHQPVHPAIWSAAWRQAGGEDRADVGEHRAAEVRPAGRQGQERLVAEPQHLGVAGGGDRHRARAAVEERDLAERADGRDRAARRVQAAVDQQVERAVALPLGQDRLAGAEQPRLGVLEQQGPVLVAAVFEEPGRVLARQRLVAGVLEEAGRVHHGWIRVIELSAWLATQTAPAPEAMPSGFCPTGIGEPTTRPVFGSRRVTLLSALLVTHTKPLPKASWRGLLPTVVVPRTFPVLRSRRVTVPSPEFATQAASRSRSRRGAWCRPRSGRRRPRRSTGRCA